jgi:signal transduction histidine kinase/PAS domain-containing protein/ActR/RegA family two-component response regulator
MVLSKKRRFMVNIFLSNMDFTIFSILFFAASMMSLFVALLAWQRKSVNGAVELSRVMIAAGIWAFFVMFETASISTLDKIFWSKMAYFGAVSTPVFYFLFIMRFTGTSTFKSLKKSLILFVIPLITLILAFTNESHQLIWVGFSAISPKTNLLIYFHGIGYWIGYFAYNYLMLFYATVFLFIYIYRQKQTFRNQAWMVFVGGICPWLGGMVYVTNSNPIPGLDLAPISFVLSGIILVYGILSVDLLDLVPVARETLVEILPDGIIALDTKNRIQDINPVALEYLGIPNSNILGFPVVSCGATSIFLLNAVVSMDSEVQIEISGNNEIRTYKIIKQKIKNVEGNRLIIIRDITDQIANQNEIRAGKEKYKSLYHMFRLMADNMPDMLWAKDLDKKYTFVNKAICNNLLSATDTDEPIGKTDQFFADREQQKYPERKDWYTMGRPCLNSDDLVLKSGVTEQFDEFGYVKGKFVFTDVHKSPIFNENGEMIGIVGSSRDVTLRKMIEKELFIKDNLLRAITSAASILVKGENIGESLKGALQVIGTTTSLNRIYIFKSQVENEIDKPQLSLICEWTDGSTHTLNKIRDLRYLPLEIAFQSWFEKLSTGEVVKGKTADFEDGEKSMLRYQSVKSILVTPVFFDHKFWGFVGYDDCINERTWTSTEVQLLSVAAGLIVSYYVRKISQDELVVAKEKAEESERLKSAFLANMSHEIRTPMNSILGFISLLQESNVSDEEKDEFLKIVRSSSERLLSTIYDIIDISKIEAGQITLSSDRVSLNELNRDFYTLFKPEAEAKGLQLFYTNESTDDQIVIKTDRDKLFTIMTNLIKNALKYTKSGIVEFGYSVQDNNVQIYVKDTGIGIPENKRLSIFKRFVQADISHSRSYEGSGLGLSISKAFIEMLGGRIWVESEVGKGSTFFFQMPLEFNQAISLDSDRHSLEKELVVHKTLRILIVESDQSHFDYLSDMLFKAKQVVFHAFTGSEVVELCRQCLDIDIVLMNLSLSDMGGCEVARKIRDFNTKIPVIALSALASDVEREVAFTAGCSDYISTPVTKELLIMALNRFLESPE